MLLDAENINNGLDEPVMVSIKCLVYNHAPFLRKCLDGFVMQKTNFKFEAVVHDDASTDNSVEIIKEYAEKYPDIIKPIFETENQYSKGDGSLGRILNAACHGKYIAICEGDDYWTDSNKLQRQVDFLESHHDYVAVAENGIIHYLHSQQNQQFNKRDESDINIEELIKKRQFPTASVLYKRDTIQADYFNIRYHYDTMLWCYLVSKGKFRYLTNISSVYNRGAGVTETTRPYRWAATVEKWNRELIRVFGSLYNTKISKDNVYENYKGAMIKSFNRKDYCGFLLCSIKCIRQKPIITIKFFCNKVLLK